MVTLSNGEIRTALEGLTGYAEPESFKALMGPSGSGKSTLLDALSSRLASNAFHLALFYSMDAKESSLSAQLASAFFITQTLRALSRDGRTVIASIHKPNSEVFELFDQLYLLSGGNTVYFGQASEADQELGYI